MALKINLPNPLIVFDTETGGLDGDFEIKWNRDQCLKASVNSIVEGRVTKTPAPILEIGAVVLSPSTLDEIAVFHTICGPEKGQTIENFMSQCSDQALKINGFGERVSELAEAKPLSECLKDFIKFIPNRFMAGGQNLRFDMHMIESACYRFGINYAFRATPIELAPLAQIYFSLPDTPIVANYKLTTIAQALGVPTENAHTALADVRMTVACLKKILEKFTSF